MFNKISYVVKNNNDRVIASSNYIDSNTEIVHKINSSNEIIEYNNIKFRVGKIDSKNGIIFAFSDSKDFLKSSKQFKVYLNILESFLDEFVDIKDNVTELATKQVKILIHNLISLNAHNLQEIYNLVPQENLANSIQSKKSLVSNKIKANPNKAALALLKLMKNNVAMKTEFSVFNKLFDPNPQLNMKNHVIHRVLMNIFYSFFSDFTDNNIHVNISPSMAKAYFDYESIYVAFFHLIENSTKYIKPNTQLNILFNDLINEVEIIFDMISLKIDNNEKEKIFFDGYSGITAEKYEKGGNGIGMSRVKKIIELNNGTIHVENTNTSSDDYQNNKFILKLKKENYFI